MNNESDRMTRQTNLKKENLRLRQLLRLWHWLREWLCFSLAIGEFFGWTNIVAVKAGEEHSVGIQSDGTVVAVGYNKWGQINLDKLVDIRVP